LILSLFILELYQEAVDDFNEVINLQPHNAHAFFGRGLAYKNMKKYEEAAEDFEKAKECQPNNPALMINYKKLYDVKYIKLCDPGEEKN
jgi:tetratricopeptide (TPR) repeat protein